MASGNENKIMRTFLAAQAGIIAAVATRIYIPRIPEGATLPAIGFFVNGGDSTPYIPEVITPSFQFDCWAADDIGARAVYTALYDALQGVQGETVTVGGVDYRLMSVWEEVHGQDIQEVENPGYHRVLSFWKAIIEI